MDINNFWNNVDIKYGDDWWKCWEWKLYKDRDGYGKVKILNKKCLSHRIAYQLTNPNVDIKYKVIRHICDNPPCCNPYHLLIGTHIDNVKDRVERNRTIVGIGENNGKSKLKNDDILEIRELFKNNNYSMTMLAKKFHITLKPIRKILKGEAWISVGIPEDLIKNESKIARGEKVANSKLKSVDIIEIWKLFENGWMQVSIAKKFNVSKQTINQILNGKSWKHMGRAGIEPANH